MRRASASSCVLAISTAAFLWAAPLNAGDIIPPKSFALSPGGVNAADGSFSHVVTDLSIGPMKVERFHRTGRYEPDGGLLPIERWRDNFDVYVMVTRKVSSTSGTPVTRYLPIVHIGNSASGVYWQDTNTLSSIKDYNADAGSGILEWQGSNTWSSGYFIYTDKSGTVYTFNSSTVAYATPSTGYSRRVSRIDFPDGRVQTFTYSGDTLTLVEDSSGYAIRYDGSTVCGFNRAVTYVTSTTSCATAPVKVTYTTSTGSFQVLDVTGQTTAYTVGADGVTCIKPPGYVNCKVTNNFAPYANDQSQVASQALSGGGTWTFGRSDMSSAALNSPDVPPPYDGHNEVTVTDPAAKQIALTFTKTSPYTMVDANGRASSFLYYGGVSMWEFSETPLPQSEGTYLMEATLPEGNKYLAEYNGPYASITKQTMKAKPGSGLPDLVETFGYGPCSSPGTLQSCGKPVRITDAKGNQTDFTYASHGSVLSEMKSAPSVGAARPLKLTTWVQKYAYIKGSLGTLGPAASPIWVIASETECQTVAGSNTPTCDTAATAPKRLTTYEYGADGTANNLNVRGVVVTADGTSRRTCYGYDNYGNRISQTTPRAGLTSCP